MFDLAEVRDAERERCLNFRIGMEREARVLCID